MVRCILLKRFKIYEISVIYWCDRYMSFPIWFSTGQISIQCYNFLLAFSSKNGLVGIECCPMGGSLYAYLLDHSVGNIELNDQCSNQFFIYKTVVKL